MLRLRILTILFLLFSGTATFAQQSSFVSLNPDGSLSYTADSRGNTIPDFSAVGYRRSDAELPEIGVVKTVSPASSGSSQQIIQDAIDEVARMPLVNGFRGAILFKKGVYNIPDSIVVSASGIVLRGEGENEGGTVWVATGTGQRTLLDIRGSGSRTTIAATRTEISDSFVPVGAFSFNVASSSGYSAGDKIIITRPGTDEWIKDLKMDQIPGASASEQWKANEYNLYYEREITRVEGNRIYIDNPVVMEMEDKYGGGYISKYNYPGRISDVGVEYIRFESEYAHDTDEDHGWVAVKFGIIENAWARNIISRYFGYSCAFISGSAKYVTIKDSKCLDAKSQITGSRRYSFNMAGRSQLNLVTGCHTTEGRHDYVTGARMGGPNVFHNSTSVNARSDTGPHQRWATGTLYDNISTDGVINVQERRSGGHGWTGVTQVLWNCTALRTSVQSPWVSGKNYAIAVQGQKYAGSYYSDRPDGEWELHNSAVVPSSLYEAQLHARRLALPMDARLNSFVAELKDGQIHISWATTLEQKVTSFELLHSTDNLNFTDIATLPASGNNIGMNYSFTHAAVSSGINYYKLSLKDATSQIELPYLISVSGMPEEGNVFFAQNFNQGAFVADFVKSEAQDKNFFDDAGVTTTGGAYSKIDITGSKLIIDRSGRPSSGAPTERVYFTRSTNLSPTTQFIKVSFKFNATNINNTGSTQATFAFGEGFTNDGELVDNTTAWERIGISHNSSNGFALRDGTGSTADGTYYPADGNERTITLYLNATDSQQIYTGPDGASHTIPAQTWNAFVGAVKQFSSINRAPAQPTKRITNFKFYATGGSAIYGIDDLVMEALPDGTTPVSLVSFTGSNNGSVNELKWVTSSEQNNSHFEILRSADGINFTQIGTKEGNGTIQQVTNYSFTDYNPLAGIGYYKLLQVDFNGKSEEYGPVAIENRIEKSRLRIESVKDNVLSVGYIADKEQTAKIFITDILGRNIYSTSLQLQSGYNQNNLPFSPGNSGGIFIISIITGDEVHSLKFIDTQ